MARYGMDFGRPGAGERYDWNRGFNDRSRGYGGGSPSYGGMRSDGWGGSWRDFPGEEGWYGEGYAGYPGGGYDVGYGGGMRGGFEAGGGRYDRMMQGGGYGGGMMQGGGYGGGYTGRDTGYGGYDYERSRGFGTSDDYVGSRGGSSGGRGMGQTRAAEIMTDNPECVTPDATLTEVAKKMREMDVGIIPVVDSMENRRLRGVITDRDITIRAVAEGKDGKAKVSDCMTTEVETVNKNDPVREVLDIMRSEQVRRVPVTDREGRLVGIIAQADLSVDFGAGDPSRERMVEDTIERISEPARPQRGAMAAQSRSQGGQGGMQATSRESGTQSRGGRNRPTEA